MKYVRTDQRVESILYMSPETFSILLNSKQCNARALDFIESSVAYQTKVSRLTDVRANRTQAAKEYLSYLINNSTTMPYSDFTLKAIELGMVFANKEYYDSLSDLSDEQIAECFCTDVETVQCKKAFDAKVQNLANQSSFQKRK